MPRTEDLCTAITATYFKLDELDKLLRNNDDRMREVAAVAGVNNEAEFEAMRSAMEIKHAELCARLLRDVQAWQRLMPMRAES